MGTTAGVEHSRLTNLWVLVAEDDSDVAESVELYLQLFGCKVDIAADGRKRWSGRSTAAMTSSCWI